MSLDPARMSTNAFTLLTKLEGSAKPAEVVHADLARVATMHGAGEAKRLRRELVEMQRGGLVTADVLSVRETAGAQVAHAPPAARTQPARSIPVAATTDIMQGVMVALVGASPMVLAGPALTGEVGLMVAMFGILVCGAGVAQVASGVLKVVRALFGSRE